MKLKISWPTGIIIAITAFVIFILSFVYKVTFMPKYGHHLVSEDYYKDELNYQQEIDKENNQKSPVNNAKEKFEVLFFDEVKNGRTSVFTEKQLSSFIYKEVQYTEPSYSIIRISDTISSSITDRYPSIICSCII